MANVTIRHLSVLVIPRFHRLFGEAVERHFNYFPSDYRQQVLRDHHPLKLFLATIDPRRIILVAYVDRQIVGYAVGSVPKDGRGQLYWLYIDPDQRGQNTGLALMSRMIKLQAHKGAKEVQLITYDHRKYYQRQGFRFVKKVTEHGLSQDVMSFRITAHHG